MTDDLDLRKGFHDELDRSARTSPHLAASVIEAIPRATQVLLDGDLEGADYLILADDEHRRPRARARGALLPGAGPPGAGGQRPAPGHGRREDDRRDRAVRRPLRQHLQGGPADLRPRARPPAARHHHPDERAGPAAVHASPSTPTSRPTLPLAAALDDMDDMLDRLQVEFIAADLREPRREPHSDLQVAVQLALVARFYERIGDHAVNIGERVRYMVTGWLPNHEGAAKLRSLLYDTPSRRPPPARRS